MKKLVLALFLSAAPPPAIRAAGPSQETQASNELYSVRVLEVSGYDDFRSKFEILDLKNGTAGILEFSLRTVGYKEILLRPGAKWAVAVGRLPRGGYSLAVIDLAASRLRDEIWCYDYTLSPSGRLLLLQSHYPKMALPATRRSILLLYRLQLPPEANRAPGAGAPTRENAGVPVYPAVNREAGSYDVTLDQEHRYLGPKLWLPEEAGVVFLDFRVADKENFLVRLEVERQAARQTEKPIPLEPLVDWSKMSDERRLQIEESGYGLVPDALEWIEPGSTLRLVPWEQPWLQKEIILTVPGPP